MSAPKLEQYPGYYPAGSKPFWSRTKVGIAAGVTGLLIGIAGGGSEADTPAAASPPSSDGPSVTEVQADLDEALAAKDDLSDQLRDQADEAANDSAKAEKAAAKAQKRAVTKAVAKARQEERKKAAAAVEKARQEAKAAAAPPSPVPLAAPEPATDRRYSYCYEANAAGLGPYYQGQDPEYYWYDDRDGDGVVCET